MYVFCLVYDVQLSNLGGEDYCAPGATCEFFLMCWLSGGVLENACDGMLKGCCSRGTSKAGRSPGLAVGTLEAPQHTPKSQASLLDLDESSKWYRTLGTRLLHTVLST